MALALPRLRWLLVGAVAAGAWVVREDMKAPHPSESVPPAKVERSAGARPRPQKPASIARPVPPEPLAPKAAGSRSAALALPKAVERPPARPGKETTGSVRRPGNPAFVQTRSRVRLRAQARADASVIATLEPRTVMREVARSGDWRLLVGGGRKGWVRADYLTPATYLSRRPKLPVAEVR
jgi:hypothetical protein